MDCKGDLRKWKAGHWMTVTGCTYFGWDFVDVCMIMVELFVLFIAVSIQSVGLYSFQFSFETLYFRFEGLKYDLCSLYFEGNFLRCDNFVIRLV